MSLGYGGTRKEPDRARHSLLIIRCMLFLLSSLSILSLLSYFLGLGPFAQLTSVLLAIEILGIFFLVIWMKRAKETELSDRLIRGLWAGALATLAYDVVRVPIAHAGIPVFKAISYFGTVFMGIESPTPLSEAVGWAYHLSNGVSFALMYVVMISRPGLVTAVLWGMSLEGLMLLTPYAEVFGYRRDSKFLAMTIGAHAVYGLVLWLSLRISSASTQRLRTTLMASGFVFVPLGLLAMAADFNTRYANSLPASPPASINKDPNIDKNNYTTWDVPEPDRIVAMWVMHRFVEPEAKFYFIRPFDRIQRGEPFDLPEAGIRRHGIQSATEYLLETKGITSARLGTLARMTHLNEVTPWMLASDVEAGQLTQMLRDEADRNCGASMTAECLPRLFAALDKWYDEQ